MTPNFLKCSWKSCKKRIERKGVVSNTQLWQQKGNTKMRFVSFFYEQRGALCGTRPRPPLSGTSARWRREQRRPLRALLQPHPAGKPPGTHDGEADQSPLTVSSLVCYPCSLNIQLLLRLQEQVTAVSLDRSDMHRWMAAFPNPTNPDGDEDEVIYEDWGEDYSDSTVILCLFLTPIVSYAFVCVSQIVLRCSVWSNTPPSRQTSSPWSPPRSSTSSAKPMRVRARRESQTKELQR